MFDRILRGGDRKNVRVLADLVPDIGVLEPEMQSLSDDDLRHKTVQFRERLERGEPLDDLLFEAFAVTREAAVRVLGQRHYDVQLMGGAGLHFGWVSEMKTGEGKTLVSTLPVYLNGLTGKGVHVITVNDYLATRDAEQMGRLHNWLGLEVGLIVPGRPESEYKRRQYACDVTYGTNNEFGFDYLRDNMAMSRETQVQRGHVYAIVDEVDSILIDEARTPLIISGQLDGTAKLYTRFATIARALKRDVDYEVDEEKRTVSPLDSGIEKVEKALGLENMYDDVSSNFAHQLTVALKAKELFHRDKDYLIADGEVKIVDEFTGRVLEGRRWSEGIHQAVEAKENVRIKEESQTLATVTLQNYFRLYDKLAGMTGTAQTEAAELMTTYDLQVVSIPTHRGVVRLDQSDLIYKSEDAKFDAVANDIEERVERGQPVLVGTISVEKSEKLSRILDKRGVPHEVLNAKQHFREADVVAQAGQSGKVTVATNMAGRGVDILLGGYPDGLAHRECIAQGLEEGTEEWEAAYDTALATFRAQCKADGDKVREAGGLYVLGTERHESRRIDNQLRGRFTIEIAPGESRFYLSLDDELMRIFATGAISMVMGKNWPDDQHIEHRMVTKAIERAQNTVEQRNAEIRKNVLKYDEVMNEQRKVIYQRRDLVLDGEDLSELAMSSLAEVVDSTISSYCVSNFKEEWDIEALHNELNTYWPVSVSEATAEEVASTDELYEFYMHDARDHYAAREDELGTDRMRDVERQVMLRIIDQRWREHLREMDYLQDGIGLRAMGQKDPLTEWRREGFDMFEQLMDTVSKDFVRYIMHIQLVQQESEPEPTNVEYTAPDEQAADGADSIKAVARERASEEGREDPADSGSSEEAQRPVVKDGEFDNVGRNEPCPCGSGKKFKVCHGR